VDGRQIVLPATTQTVDIGTLLSGASIQITTKLKLENPGLHSFTSEVRSDGRPHLGNNTITERLEVISVPTFSIHQSAMATSH
jgi:hypothetical protein